MSFALNLDGLERPQAPADLEEHGVVPNPCPHCHHLRETHPSTAEGAKKANKYRQIIFAILRVAIPIILTLAALGGMGYWAYTAFSGTIVDATKPFTMTL